MKNKFWIYIILLIIFILIIGSYFFIKNNKMNNNNYNVSKTSINEKNTDIKKIEKEIASFSTKIYNKEPNRQNNVTITCNTLNNTIVSNNSTFSFCNTVGKSTSDKGYLEADIFDKYGNKTKGIGGGNCQVSTTLYNAILKVPELTIIERHEHSNKVPYIEDGKDAAVAYGSYDLQFKNNYGYDIKIKAINTDEEIKIVLMSIAN